MSRVQRLFFRFLSSLRHPSVIAGFSLTSLPLRPEIRIRAEHNLPPFDPRRELRTFRESFVSCFVQEWKKLGGKFSFPSSSFNFIDSILPAKSRYACTKIRVKKGYKFVLGSGTLGVDKWLARHEGNRDRSGSQSRGANFAGWKVYIPIGWEI